MFKMIDTDNSGHITFEELKDGLKRFGANLKESEIYDLLHAVSFGSKGFCFKKELVQKHLLFSTQFREANPHSLLFVTFC